MSDTIRRKKYTKKELVTSEIHRKAGPHKVNKVEPRICPACRGSCVEEGFEDEAFLINCTECGGTGIV